MRRAGMRTIPERKRCRVIDAGAGVMIDAGRGAVPAAAVGGLGLKAAVSVGRAVVARDGMTAADRESGAAEASGEMMAAAVGLAGTGAADLAPSIASRVNRCRKSTRPLCRVARLWIPWPSRSD